MNQRQQIAMDSPCFTFDACGLFVYRKDEPGLSGTRLLTTVLTLEAFSAPYQWHVSAAFQITPQVFLPYEELLHLEKRTLANACMKLLEGVGLPETRYAEAHPYSLHCFQWLKDSETIRVGQRRLVVDDFISPMGSITPIGREEAIDGYGWNPDRALQV